MLGQGFTNSVLGPLPGCTFRFWSVGYLSASAKTKTCTKGGPKTDCARVSSSVRERAPGPTLFKVPSTHKRLIAPLGVTSELRICWRMCTFCLVSLKVSMQLRIISPNIVFWNAVVFHRFLVNPEVLWNWVLGKGHRVENRQHYY